MAGRAGQQQDGEIPEDYGEEDVDSGGDPVQASADRVFDLPQLLPRPQVRGQAQLHLPQEYLAGLDGEGGAQLRLRLRLVRAQRGAVAREQGQDRDKEAHRNGGDRADGGRELEE